LKCRITEEKKSKSHHINTIYTDYALQRITNRAVHPSIKNLVCTLPTWSSVFA